MKKVVLSIAMGLMSLSSFAQQGLTAADSTRLAAYKLELAPIDQQMSDILAKARAGQIAKEQMDSIGELYTRLASQKEARILEIIKENSNNMIPVAFIDRNLAYSMDYEQLKQLCSPSNAFFNHPVMEVPKQLLANMEKHAIGKQFTDMTIPDMNGKERKLSEWIGKGKYVMIDFWASWCGPCRQEMPNVVENYKKYHAKGFEIIGISFDRSAEPWKKAVEQMGMTWPQLSDLGYWQSAAAGVYGINSIPASILFDGEGKIIATNLRGEKLGEKLQELYK